MSVRSRCQFNSRGNAPASQVGTLLRSFSSAALLVAVALIATAATTSAQTVSGVVLNSINRTPVSNARVSIAGTTREFTTDASGQFQLLAVGVGTHTLIVQRVGYAEKQQSIVTTGTALTNVEVLLVAAPTLISPVVVTASGENERRRDATATIDGLDGNEIRETRATHPSGIMNRIPGVHVTELSGEGHSTAIRQPMTTKPVYLYLEDGIPTRSTGFFNHNALYEVNLPQAGGIEVLKGPGTALYGSDAIGGVVNALTRPAPATPGIEGNFEGGSFGYRRLMLTGGGWMGTSGVRLDLNITDSDGWKDNAPYQRISGTVRWDAAIGDQLTLKTVVTGSTIDQNDVPSINQTEFDESRSLNKAPIAYRGVDALRISAALEKDAGSMLWSVTPYARYNTLKLLPSWQLTYDQQVWDSRNTSLGVVARYRRDFDWWSARVIVGTDAELSPGSFVADGITATRSASDNRIWSTYSFKEHQYDYDVTYRVIAPYLHTELMPIPGLRVDLGARYDASEYEYTTNLEPINTGVHRRPGNTTVNYSRLSPKAGINFAVSNSASLFASYREGFRAPSHGQVFQQNSAANTVDLKPVKVTSYELGVRGELGSRVLYSLNAYDMKSRDDILTFQTPANTREAVNAGETRHRGIEAGLSVAVTAALKLDAAYSVANHEYVHWVPRESETPANRVDYSGNDMEQAPRVLANLLLTWSPAALKGGRAAIEWSKLGKYALDPGNTHYTDGYALLNAHFNYQILPSVELFAKVLNLADADYAELMSFDAFQGEQFTAGAPRAVFLGLKYGWQR